MAFESTHRVPIPRTTCDLKESSWLFTIFLVALDQVSLFHEDKFEAPPLCIFTNSEAEGIVVESELGLYGKDGYVFAWILSVSSNN